MKIENRNRWTKFALVSLIIIAIALVLTIIGRGLNLGVDFTGGTIMTYNMGTDFDVNDIENALAQSGVSNAQIAKIGSDGQQAQIRIADSDNTDELRDSIENTLREKYAGLEYVDITRVGPTAGSELVRNAVQSMIWAAVLMLIYIAIRFDFYMGLAAVIGLAHDIAIMLSFTIILRGIIRVETTYIAALLTIVGYSINNTIIIFDRVRENSHKADLRQLTRGEIVDRSVQESLARTLNTSITTLLTIVTLYILGVDSIRQFALPLIIGILSGIYSSNLLNGYVWAWLMDHRKNAVKVRKKA
ncbi:MAG: protein translocase subunit SecF [Clostridiales bacterium]|nr:protein translocase subunit SecF [Clostridiales bacterium]